jgi:hypothetical protein
MGAPPDNLEPIDISTGISTWTHLEAALENRALFEIAEVVDRLATPDPVKGGRRRLHPTWAILLYQELLWVWRSARHVDAELRHPRVWGWLRDRAEVLFPDEPHMQLPEAPMRRHHFLYFQRKYLTAPHIQERMAEAHREIAASQAVEIGLLDPDGPGSWTHPHRSRMLYGDGKVLTPRFKAKPDDPPHRDRTTGELRQRRFDPDAGWHVEGGDPKPVWGTKHVLVLARGENPHSRMILDVAGVSKPGAEAEVVMDSIRRLRPLVPGAQGVVYDMILRGVHKQALLQDGLLPIVRVPAKRAARKTSKGVMPRIPKDSHIEDKDVRLRDGTTRLFRVHAVDGAAGIVELEVTGKPHAVSLERGRIRPFEAAEGGSIRWYGTYEVPETFGGGGTLTLRLDQTPEDRRRGFNRTEVLSPIPSSDPDFKSLAPLRPDAESNNAALEDKLFNKRAHSVGHLSQRANLLGYALLVNSLTLYLSKRRGARGRPPPRTVAA